MYIYIVICYSYYLRSFIRFAMYILTHEILWWRWSRFSCTADVLIIIEETRIPAATCKCTLNIIYWQSSIFPAETTGRSNNFKTRNAQDEGYAAIYYAITSSVCVCTGCVCGINFGASRFSNFCYEWPYSFTPPPRPYRLGEHVPSNVFSKSKES